MAKRKRVINGIINLVEGYGDNMLNFTKFGLWEDIQLGFVTIMFLGVLLNTSSHSLLFGVLFFLAFSAFAGRMFWRYKKRQKADSNAVPFFDEEPEESYAEYTADVHRMVTGNSYDANASNSRHEKVADSWDIKDPKPPWEL